MSNRSLDLAWTYHDATKHSVARLRANRHFLDWKIKPRPFKIYPQLPPIPLPAAQLLRPTAALAAVAHENPPVRRSRAVPDLPTLAAVLYFTAGITRKKVYPGGQVYDFRAAACTGALYHIDLYVICGDVPSLAAGVYHFGPHNFSLVQLRAGDFRANLVEASGAEPAVLHAPVILAYASTYWRNSWKYQARTYRHCFWDSGTMLANLLAVAAADQLPAGIVCGFVDAALTTLLGLEPAREGALALVALGHDPTLSPAPPRAVPALALETLPLSSREVDYPAIRAMHAASVLKTPDEVRAWRANAQPDRADPAPQAQTSPLCPLDAAALPSDPIDAVIRRRGSTRHFSHRPITFAQLSTILRYATRGIPSDYGASPTDLYLIANAVEGLQSGPYVYHRAAASLELLRAGTFRREAGYLGLGQQLPADASVNIYALCDLQPVLARHGNRGYRVAQLDAAVIGGRLYLATYALHLGATGLTFFDDEVTAFFSPHARGKSVMFLVAIGRGRQSTKVESAS
ncbi:MAG: SagB family peptide dehydrogenase [Candidatus Binatia bacterium]